MPTIEMQCESEAEFEEAMRTGHEIITPGETVRFIHPNRLKAVELSFQALGLGWGSPQARMVTLEEDFAKRLMRCSPDAGKKRETAFQAEYSKRFNAYGCMK